MAWKPTIAGQSPIFARRMAIAASVILLAAGISLSAYLESLYRNQVLNGAESHAKVLAATAIAAVAFQDRDAAAEYTAAVSADSDVLVAAIYDAAGNLFAHHTASTAAFMPSKLESYDVIFNDDRLSVAVPIIQSGERLGSAYVQVAAEPLESRLPRYGIVTALIVMASLFLLLQVAAQTTLARANAELQQQIAEREKAEAALRQAQKMEVIGRLTGGIAHDFNNILTIIFGNLDRARRRLEKRDDQADILRMVEISLTGSRRAASLVKSLMAFSRQQSLSPKVLDVNRLVSGLSELIRRTIGEHIRIETVLAAGLWQTKVDHVQLESALLNLAINARDAMPDGGSLFLETSNAYLDRQYATAAEVPEGQYIALTVSDTGVGMPKEVIEKAFEPFFTTKDVGLGTGLGLSQVYGFVRQSGGHIVLYSQLGQGTAVKIYLPRYGVGTEASLEDHHQAHDLRRAAGNILVVEDDPNVREFSTDVLRELGYVVFEASDATEALKLLERQPRTDLVFSDIGLPGGMNGRDLAKEICRLHPHLPIVLTTGYGRSAIARHGPIDNSIAILSKPFTVAELSGIIERTLENRQK